MEEKGTSHYGGRRIASVSFTKTFKRDYKRLAPERKQEVDQALRDLLRDPRPQYLRFEKLKGYTDPPVYTIHSSAKFKISMEIDGEHALLRHVGHHDELDRRA